jgi:hypothetical protein
VLFQVGLDDVLDDVLCILQIHSQHLNGLTPLPYRLRQLPIYLPMQRRQPGRVTLVP